MKAEIEDTYAEAFDGIYSRVTVTADHKEVLKRASENATATPSIVIGRIEGGIEKYLDKQETLDGRNGVILQFWGGLDENKPLEEAVKKFEAELSFRIRQDILVKPFTALFDALPKAEGKMGMMERVGHCGDGFEWEEKLYGRNMIVVPLMVSNFLIERELGYAKGVMGANFWFMCETKQAVMEGGRKALDAIHQVPDVITPFDICSAGSKPETKFPLIGPTTNHPYCSTLKESLGEISKVPEGVNYIPEIVINGTSLEAVKEAMKAGIRSAAEVKGVVRVSAGNYGGKLGKHRIYLQELFR
ncbi:MAG: formylmethanofuran--tetrahydromethanopterin N-formyltransferase [Candidatus Bathyarchaeota archaeon]|nr:formylmethanofuran--tetrahydromethanopterin N-formyltransferase [Candidatus Bathyarchaeota archaeon]